MDILSSVNRLQHKSLSPTAAVTYLFPEKRCPAQSLTRQVLGFDQPIIPAADMKYVIVPCLFNHHNRIVSITRNKLYVLHLPTKTVKYLGQTSFKPAVPELAGL